MAVIIMMLMIRIIVMSSAMSALSTTCALSAFAVIIVIICLFAVIIIMITMIIMSRVFSNMVARLIWWWQVELPSGMGACVGGVAVRVPANLEMVLVTMVCCVISGLIKTADVEVRGNRPLTHQILFHVDSS